MSIKKERRLELDEWILLNVKRMQMKMVYDGLHTKEGRVWSVSREGLRSF